MQKKDVVAKIASDAGITKKEATVAYNSFINLAKNTPDFSREMN